MSKEFLLLSNLRISKVLEYSRQKILTRKLSFKTCYNKRTMHTNCMNGNLLYRILNTQSSIFPYTQQYKVKVCCRINEFRYVRLAISINNKTTAGSLYHCCIWGAWKCISTSIWKNCRPTNQPTDRPIDGYGRSQGINNTSTIISQNLCVYWIIKEIISTEYLFLLRLSNHLDPWLVLLGQPETSKRDFRQQGPARGSYFLFNVYGKHFTSLKQ